MPEPMGSRLLGAVLLVVIIGVVFIGGIARVRSWQQRGRPHPISVLAIVLETVGVPIVLAWQRRVSSG